MARIKIRAEIAAPPAEVAVFFVPQRMPYWYAGEIHAEFEISEGGADFRAGQKVRIRGELAGREVGLTAVITRYEFGRFLEWRFQDAAGVRGLQSWELLPVAAGTCVALRDEYEMPGRLGRVLDRMFTSHAVARRDRQALVRLARLAERR